MPKLKLTYFDIHGGRGEVARLALSVGGVPFEDDRVKRGDWPARKPNMPFGGLPVLEVDGVVIAQSNTINRFAGKLAGLYPESQLEAAFCDEIMDAVEDISTRVAETMAIADEEEKKKQRVALADGLLSFFLRAVAARLAERGGRYFADGRLTVADLKVFLWIRHLRSGVLDHIPKDLADRVAPALVEHFERVKAHPGVAAYYASRGVS